MARTFGYSCRNSRSNGSGTRCLIASRGVRVTTGCQAWAWSIHWVCTATDQKVTGDPVREHRIYKGIGPEPELWLLALPGRLALFGEGGEPLLRIGRFRYPAKAPPLPR